jgi:hypothetical protein
MRFGVLFALGLGLGGLSGAQANLPLAAVCAWERGLSDVDLKLYEGPAHCTQPDGSIRCHHFALLEREAGTPAGDSSERIEKSGRAQGWIDERCLIVRFSPQAGLEWTVEIDLDESGRISRAERTLRSQGHVALRAPISCEWLRH